MPPQTVVDASVSFLGGQDASKSPSLIPENAYFAGVNVSTERGNLRPRWGWEKKKNLTFPEGGVIRKNLQVKSFQDVFRSGKFQALADYSIGSEYYIVVVISGQIFFISKSTFSVQHISLEGEQINPRAQRIRWSQAGKYLVFFDFPAYPVIIEGITARRADPEQFEIPVSDIGGYNQNRLIVGNAGNEFTAGDPAGSLAAPNAPITFLEVLTQASPFFGQVFQLNTNYNNDPITAVGFLQVSDTSTGIGPLLVATKKAIYSYPTQNPRDTWEAGQFGSVLVYNAGIVGPRAIENLNSDVIFFSPDGMARSISMSRDEQKKWSKTPISKEVQNWLIVNDQTLLQHSFITYFNNKVFLSANPFRTEALGINDEPLPDYAFGGVVVLELDNISTITKETPPVWAGLWTGVRPMDMVVCDDRCFAISKDAGVNELYELRPDLTYDTDGENIRYIESKIYTREYDFRETVFSTKQLHSIDLALREVRGDFSVKTRFRPDHSTNFVDWREFKHIAPWRVCRAPFDFRGYAPHSFLNVNLGSPANIATSCSEPTRTQNQAFRRIQFELTFEGIYWELEALRIAAIMNPEIQNITSCPKYKPVAIPRQCLQNWSYKGFEGCERRIS